MNDHVHPVFRTILDHARAEGRQEVLLGGTTYSWDAQGRETHITRIANGYIARRAGVWSIAGTGTTPGEALANLQAQEASR